MTCPSPDKPIHRRCHHPLLSATIVLCLLACIITPSSAVPVDPGNIERITRDLCDLPRVVGSEEEAAAYVAGAMEEYGLQVAVERFRVGKTDPETSFGPASNIIGVKKGATDQIVIVCAHYDAADETPGADDNAAGVAVMLEVARLLQDTTLNRTLYFIAFSGEEDGMQGSQRWVGDHRDLHDLIVVAVNLDCIASGERLWVSALPQHRWFLGAIPPSACLDQAEAPVLTSRGEEFSFYGDLIPIVRFGDTGSHTFIHTPEDHPDRLNYTLAGECARLVAGGIRGIDTRGNHFSPDPEVWIENGTVFFNSPGGQPFEVFVDGQSLGVLPSGSVTLPGGTHEVRVAGYDPGGTRTFATVTREGRATLEPTVSGEGVIIPWNNKADFTYTAIPLPYNLEHPEKIDRVDGYIDGVQISGMKNGHTIIPTPGNHTFGVVAYGADGSIIGSDQKHFSLRRFCDTEIDGGALHIDENGGIHCSAFTRTYIRDYVPGERYTIVVTWDYGDATDATAEIAHFRLVGPEGNQDSEKVFDIPFIDNSQDGNLSIWFQPPGAGDYHWTIRCNEGGENASAIGDLSLR
ncbi:M28 family metallopeptidase [Methanofollis sp. UBA420]|jgi:hypothetical protein|uniref:M28 family metallopeptidase n=1 Tax=Methanofollis sp. UBA420 TaxID=1915514 RepID=UPI00316AD1C6